MFIGRRGDNSIYGCWTVRQHDGQEELADDHPEVVAFLAPRSPIDQADIDNLEKNLKALAMTFAQITNTPLATVRTIFRQKRDALP